MAGDPDRNLCLHAALQDAALVAQIVLDTTIAPAAPIVPVAKRQKQRRRADADANHQLEKGLEALLEADEIPEQECPLALYSASTKLIGKTLPLL